MERLMEMEGIGAKRAVQILAEKWEREGKNGCGRRKGITVSSCNIECQGTIVIDSICYRWIFAIANQLSILYHKIRLFIWKIFRLFCVVILVFFCPKIKWFFNYFELSMWCLINNILRDFNTKNVWAKSIMKMFITKT